MRYLDGNGAVWLCPWGLSKDETTHWPPTTTVGSYAWGIFASKQNAESDDPYLWILTRRFGGDLSRVFGAYDVGLDEVVGQDWQPGLGPKSMRSQTFKTANAEGEW